ncbi:hypothetical protein AHF37_02841 [Paragonimus kellicotti]|nr:hypothetical protein AHF37_02841 [Paragonimus kellicotti]
MFSIDSCIFSQQDVFKKVAKQLTHCMLVEPKLCDAKIFENVDAACDRLVRSAKVLPISSPHDLDWDSIRHYLHETKI